MMNPGPNNRALTTGGDDPKGGAILKITCRVTQLQR